MVGRGGREGLRRPRSVTDSVSDPVTQKQEGQRGNTTVTSGFLLVRTPRLICKDQHFGTEIWNAITRTCDLTSLCPPCGRERAQAR